MAYEPEKLIGFFACVIFPFAVFGLIAIGAWWVDRHTPPEPEPDFWSDETQPPQRNFEVVLTNKTQPLDAIMTEDDTAPPDSRSTTLLGRKDHDPS